MTLRSIQNEYQRDAVIKLIAGRPVPFSVEIVAGRKRSTDQNKLQRRWINEIAEQLGDRTAEEVRGECKLRFGVPILRAENEIFCEKYDRIIKPLPYETKLEMMQEPLDFPVTRLMTVAQTTKYLDAISRFYSEQGVILSQLEAA